MSTPIEVVVFKGCKICPTSATRRKIGRYLLDKKNKISAAPQTVAAARIAPKICHVRPPTFGSQSSKFHPNRFTFCGVVAERVNTVLPRRVFP